MDIYIRISGARTHNLKQHQTSILQASPADRVTGLSGSGRASFAFDHRSAEASAADT